MNADPYIMTALGKRLEAFEVSAPLTQAVALAEIGGEDFQKPAATPGVRGSGMWIEPRLFPNPPGRTLFGNEAANYRGYLQASCCIRRGKFALYHVSLLAGQVADHFPKGLAMTENGVIVNVSRPTGAGGVVDQDGELRIPVIIHYQAIA